MGAVSPLTAVLNDAIHRSPLTLRKTVKLIIPIIFLNIFGKCTPDNIFNVK
jgi:hypothetical protein